MMGELKKLYPCPDFQLESQAYAKDQGRQSLYRVLVLFLLSIRTKDKKLVQVCRRFFDEFPKAVYLVNAVDSEVVTIIKPLTIGSETN